MNQELIGVIGAGTMGNGIAQVFAQHGYEVILQDISDDALDKAIANIEQSLSRLVKKERLREDDKKDVLDRITTSTEIHSLEEAALVVEAATENEALKKQIFTALDKLCHQGTILATNTSSISITELASVTERPEQVIGMHFMNPVPVMTLVEIIRGQRTSDEVYRIIEQLTLKLAKTPVCSEDFPGFIANRILMPMINEAIFTLYEGVGTAEGIDTVMKLGMNHPMGPLALADLIGLDTCLSIMEVLYDGFGDPKYRPCPLLKQMVAAGKLGRKTRIGFYHYG